MPKPRQEWNDHSDLRAVWWPSRSGFGVGYLWHRFLARGISHIANVATQAASGNLQARAKVHSQDELGQMATAFNAMLDRITALVHTEEERDDHAEATDAVLGAGVGSR